MDINFTFDAVIRVLDMSILYSSMHDQQGDLTSIHLWEGGGRCLLSVSGK